MASDTESAGPEKATIEGLAIDTWKVKLPSFFSSLPPDFFPHVGLIAVGWGSFETMFDNLLTAILKANKKEPADVRRLALRKRLSRCREESIVALAPLVGTIAYLKSIMDDAPHLYIKRNFVVHGNLGTAIGIVERDGKAVSEIRLACLGRYRGKDVRQDFSKDDLENVFYEIAHLSGRIHALSTASSALPSREIPQLRAFLENYHPTYPNPSNLPPLPESSRG